MPAREPPLSVGRYKLHDRIDSGGMGSVQLGRMYGAAGFARTVAVKRLHPHLAADPGFQSAMIDEARLASRIHHPNVVAILDTLMHEGELLLVMDYVRGESLARLLATERARGAQVPLPIVSAIAVAVLHGLHAAHEASSDSGAPLHIVHRDVSPQNVLVGADGVARLIDFGVAKAVGRLQVTQDHVLKGKLPYMAPEQLEREGQVSRRADLYSTAVVLWELLAGRRRFDVDHQGALVGLILAGVEDPPSAGRPGLSAELDALVLRGLARDPSERFATAREMADALGTLVPPASATAVGAWVEGTAAEALATRAAIVARVEAPSAASRAMSGEVPPAGIPHDGADTEQTPGAFRRRLPASVVALSLLCAAGGAFALARRPTVPVAAAPSTDLVVATAAAPSPNVSIPDAGPPAGAVGDPPAPSASASSAAERPSRGGNAQRARSPALPKSPVRFVRPD